jgi:hypothetical protein
VGFHTFTHVVFKLGKTKIQHLGELFSAKLNLRGVPHLIFLFIGQ